MINKSQVHPTAINLLNIEGKFIQKFPKGLPKLHCTNITKTNIPGIQINNVGILEFNNTELINLLNTEGTKLRLTINLYCRTHATEEEFFETTSAHFERSYIFSTVENNKIYIDTEGLNVILYLDGGVPYIKTETLNIHKVTITEIYSFEETLSCVKEDSYILKRTKIPDFINCNTTSTSQYYDFYYANGKYYALGLGSGCQRSYDGINWVSVGRGLKKVIYANNIWVGYEEVGLNPYYSTDGITWTKGNIINSSDRIKDMYYANGLWVASTWYTVYYSTNGIDWTEGTLSTKGWIQKLYYANGIWVGMGSVSSGNEVTTYTGVYYSTDGKTWTESNLKTYTQPYSNTSLDSSYPQYQDMIYAKGLWIIIGYKKSYYSTDGKTWTESSLTGCSKIRYGNGVWVAHQLNVDPKYSTDGITWKNCNCTYGLYPSSLCYANGLWVIEGSASSNQCGFTRGTLISNDGINWKNFYYSDDKSFATTIKFCNGVWFKAPSTGGFRYCIEDTNLIGKFSW